MVNERSTMAGWVGRAAFQLRPLVELAEHVLAADKVHGDDTPVKVLAPRTGKTKTGRAHPHRDLQAQRPRSASLAH